MVDVAFSDQIALGSAAVARTKALDRLRLSDTVFRNLTRIAAIGVLLLLSGVIVSLISGSCRHSGIRVQLSHQPKLEPGYRQLRRAAGDLRHADHFGHCHADRGSGRPDDRFFLTEMCPQWLRRPIGIAIELLAGIPSIIYGIWGLFMFAPFLQATLQPFLIKTFHGFPVVGALFAGPPYGIGMLTAGLILAIMVLPFVTSISRDVFEAVPPVLKEAAYGLGCTTWEVARYVVLPFTRVGVIGGVMLGLGRALGETMAVTFVIGNAHRISASLLAPGTTISASIANEFTEAVGDLYTSALISLGLILFVITFIVLAIARYMLLRIERRIG